MSTTTKLMTADEFLKLPERTSSQVLELVEGELILSPSPIARHAHTCSWLNFFIVQHLMDDEAGLLLPGTDVAMSSNTVLCPDLAYTRKERFSLTDRGYPAVVPDLCVEVISPSNVRHDRQTKLRLYAEASVPYYWIVDPERRSFECFELRDGAYVRTRLAERDEQVSAPPFEDLVIPLAKLWL